MSAFDPLRTFKLPGSGRPNATESGRPFRRLTLFGGSQKSSRISRMTLNGSSASRVPCSRTPGPFDAGVNSRA